MNIVKFEPGDMTSYRVFFKELSELECRELDEDPGLVLYGFAVRGKPLVIHPFRKVGFMHHVYYAEKMNTEHRYTIAAGMIVFQYLTGQVGGNREIGILEDYLNSPEKLGWKENWAESLDWLLK